MTIASDIKGTFRQGSNLVKLIYINLAVFLVIGIVNVFVFFSGTILPQQYNPAFWLSVPADLHQLLYRPWTVLTYMFTHENFLHILFNLLWLFWFGKIFMEYLDQKKLLSVYLLGGITGAVFYIAAFNLFPVFKPVLSQSLALGASASVLAIVMTISFYAPNHTLYLLFIGPVKLKYIAVFSLVLDVISIPAGNAGGHIAHIGGALFGILYATQYRRGKNIARWFDRMMDGLFSIFKPRPKMKVSYNKKKIVNEYDYNAEKIKKQTEIDRILDKISKSGYDSLTKQEKATLFNSGK
jgi:membrane associated rhomboid family serine protease